ncbi:MAG TPA: Ldh family oxidoreductase [Anaerolineae bacterium]
MPTPTQSKAVRISSTALTTFIHNVLTNLDVPPEPAATVAEVMVAANLRGVDSHGVALLNWYANILRDGSIARHVSPIIEAEGPGFAMVDGHNGLGAPVGVMAMNKCLDLAASNGVACITVRNSNHFGMAGYYAMRALPRDMIGLAMTNASRLIAPTFGVEPMLGTNPIAVAVPAGNERPYVLDMATSARPFGKVVMAQARGEQLPEGVAIDQEGQPVRDPEQFIQGVRQDFSTALLPLGSLAELASYKGYGLAMFVDILTGVLSGANFSKHVGADPPDPANVGHWFMAIKVEAFMPVAALKARMDSLIKELKESRKAPGQQRIYIPGEIEFETEAERLEHGIPIDQAILNQLRSLADQTGTAFNLDASDH